MSLDPKAPPIRLPLKPDIFEAAAMPWVLTVEGGYSNDPRDPGGETKYGISKRAYPELDIAALTVEDARAIYRRDYWDRLRCSDLPPALAIAVFDCGVNQGVGVAAKLLQTAARVPIDGVIGPQTIAAAQASPIEVLLPQLLSYRAVHYCSLKSASVYLRGWLLRLFRLELHCLRLGQVLHS